MIILGKNKRSIVRNVIIFIVHVFMLMLTS